MIDTIRTKELREAGCSGEVSDGDRPGQVVVRMSTFQFEQFVRYVRESERHVSDGGNVRVSGR